MIRSLAIGLLSLLSVFSLASSAATGGKLAEAQALYKQERAYCNSGQSQQDRATCLKEAGAAFAEARRDALGSTSPGALSRNATQRCDAQPAADRADCVRRITDPSATRGSAKAGGVIRESTTPSR